SRAFPTGGPEKRGGVIRHYERHTVIPVHLPAQLAHRQLRVKSRLRSKDAELQNHFRSDQVDLANEIRAACRDLFRPRIPVTRRTVLEDVADEYVFALEIDRPENFREQLAGRADEWSSGLVFRGARSLADAHEAGVGVSFAGHGVRGRRVERAARTRRDVRGDLVDRIEERHRTAEQLDTRSSNG